MKTEDFFEVLGGLDGDMVSGAKTPVTRKNNRRVWRTAVLAAALIAALAVPVAAHMIETARFNAAVEYLRSLGVNVTDLSDYSRKEIIQAVEVYDAEMEADNTIGGTPAHNGDTKMPQEPTDVTSEQIRQLTPTMTLYDVTEELGATKDVGSGICILIYRVDNSYTLTIPFAGNDAQLGVSGEDLLKALQPIVQP